MRRCETSRALATEDVSRNGATIATCLLPKKVCTLGLAASPKTCFAFVVAIVAPLREILSLGFRMASPRPASRLSLRSLRRCERSSAAPVAGASVSAQLRWIHDDVRNSTQRERMAAQPR